MRQRTPYHHTRNLDWCPDRRGLRRCRSGPSGNEKTIKSLNGSSLVYDESYSGFRASSRKPVHIEKDLTREDLRRLESIIDSNKLLKSRSVKYETGQPGSISRPA